MQWSHGSRRSNRRSWALVAALSFGTALASIGCATEDGGLVAGSRTAASSGGNGNGNGSSGDPGNAGGNSGDAGNGVGNRTIETRRSLVVTEQPILAAFPLSRVLGQLASQSEVVGLSALDLFPGLLDENRKRFAITVDPSVHVSIGHRSLERILRRRDRLIQLVHGPILPRPRAVDYGSSR